MWGTWPQTRKDVTNRQQVYRPKSHWKSWPINLFEPKRPGVLGLRRTGLAHSRWRPGARGAAPWADSVVPVGDTGSVSASCSCTGHTAHEGWILTLSRNFQEHVKFAKLESATLRLYRQSDRQAKLSTLLEKMKYWPLIIRNSDWGLSRLQVLNPKSLLPLWRSSTHCMWQLQTHTSLQSAQWPHLRKPLTA